MADFVVTSRQYMAVSIPAEECRMQVHGAPVVVHFGESEPTKGLKLFPGDVVPIQAGSMMVARKIGEFSPVLSFEVFG